MQPLISTRHGGHVDWTRHDRSRNDQAVVSRSSEGRKPVVSVSGVSVAPHDFKLNSSTRTHSESTANRRDRQTRYLLLTKDVVCDTREASKGRSGCQAWLVHCGAWTLSAPPSGAPVARGPRFCVGRARGNQRSRHCHQSFVSHAHPGRDHRSAPRRPSPRCQWMSDHSPRQTAWLGMRGRQRISHPCSAGSRYIKRVTR